MSNSAPDSDCEALLGYLKNSRGFDFTGYKRPSLMRRIRVRMQTLKIDAFADYVDHLEVHPQEFTYLFNTILINVTSFFRDPAAWEYLKEEILPRIVRSKRPEEALRFWCAGVASGEEAYSLAILLAETLPPAEFAERVKIYATDVDDEALAHARQASYSLHDTAGIPEPLREKYFEAVGSRRVLRKDLRRMIIFGRNDLVQDAPISRIDLLVCRNTLMYFNAETQSRVLARFQFALNESGFLFLGKAEMLFTQSQLFAPVDLKQRVFTKVPRITLRDRLWIMAQGENEEAANHLARYVRFREAALDSGPVAYLAVDLNGYLAVANERARELFVLTSRDLNRPLQDLDFPYRVPGLRLAIEQVCADRRPMTLPTVEWPTTSGDLRYLDVQIAPAVDTATTLLGASINVIDVTLQQRLQIEVEHARQELETAYEELQSTNEELETTNEELQSTVEELETTNEELQSTNEELETMNEELQSTNEELQTINDELRRRTEDLNHANAFLESVLTSMRGAVVVVGRNLEVLVWNHKAEDLWGLRPEEVKGKNFLNLEIGLPVQEFREPIRKSLEGENTAATLPGTNRRGRPVQCRVNCAPLLGPAKEVRGVILLMEEMGGGPNEMGTGTSSPAPPLRGEG